MVNKRVLRPERVRVVPSRFSWLDHRLVRERHVDRCSTEALALYLFLVTVADAKGLSYYGDASVCARLGLQPAQLDAARQTLIDTELIAYEAPLYQVLSLDRPGPVEPAARRRDRGPRSLGDVLRNPGAQR